MTDSLSLGLTSEWAEIERVRNQTLHFLDAHGISPDTATAVGMVACELTENAAKYGAADPTDTSIHVRVSLARGSITIEVKNQLRDREADNLTRLDGMIQWIRGFQDPFEAYLERLKEVSAQTLESAESGLGLVRIAYEGQSILDFFVDSRGVLAVSAVHHFEAPEESHDGREL